MGGGQSNAVLRCPGARYRAGHVARAENCHRQAV